MVQHRPHTTVILAMSADGKIADVRRSPARFGSKTDIAHLEEQIACFRCCFIRCWYSTRLRYNPNCIAPTTAATTN
jgi:riboflavin biosynthesis pyrimidine reductase